MQLSDFDYSLPSELIAHYPLKKRSASRLLVVQKKSAALRDDFFQQLPNYVTADDLIIFNNTRVIPARLFGQKASGGKVELLLERILDQQRMLAQIKASKTPQINSDIIIAENFSLKIIQRHGQLFELALQAELPLLALLHQHGHVPLPPYINRADESMDQDRYQTIYAKQDGAVAAPTAGLHFDQALLDDIARGGVNMDFITLHVGIGTFQPVRHDDIDQHIMHAEMIDVSAAVCQRIVQTRQKGGRIIAVGTTTVRALETVAANNMQAFCGDTDIFIRPGYRFRCVDALITNFHLPKSTLLMLISAFAGYDAVMRAYQHAIAERYRFYSYGDAMLII